LPAELPDLARPGTNLVREPGYVRKIRGKTPTDKLSFLRTELPLPHTVAFIELLDGERSRQLWGFELAAYRYA